MITFLTLEGKQISTQHSYGQRGKIRYMTKKAKDLKQSYIEQINQQHHHRIHEGDVEVTIELIFGDRVKRDRDNYHKMTMDALQDTVLVDDSQIIKATVTKKYIPKVRLTNITILDAEIHTDSTG